ncbi:MAG: SulP family inorganic anion transporter [Pirellulaceae bacterium]|nr:SulP family inorganic anion transporter [Pirellulaceae bacterium]
MNTVPERSTLTVPVEVAKPVGDRAGFRRFFRQDFLSGFLVFLIALPLCLGISLASGFPPLAGIFTAIIGSVVATLFSNSEMTIKGPAAGLIVVVLGCIETFGGDGMIGGWSAADQTAYQATLAVCVAAAVLQVAFGVFRAGIVGEFFPVAAVHGMLAAIGVIIMCKQIPVALGVSAKGEPLELLRQIPDFVLDANPAIALIGILSIAIMFLWPLVGRKFGVARIIPSPVIVLLVAVPLGLGLDLLHQHDYTLQNHKYQLGEQYLVAMPEQMFGMFRELQFPDFSAVVKPQAWPWILMFFLIGTLESILSAKAVELLDPWKRKSNLDKDVVAVGLGNFLAGMVGGLPMISEIVRSKANIDNGAQTRFANFWHGMFLLVCVAMIPMVLHLIPLAALAGMLVYTGFRLAHPREFLNVYRIGREQLLVFLVTLVAVLATDLLIGVAIGIVLKLLIHIWRGVPLSSIFKPPLAVRDLDAETISITVGDSAIFSNWIPLKRQIESLGLLEAKSVILDMSQTKLVDHNVLERLEHLRHDFNEQQLELKVVGLEGHLATTDHHLATRQRGLASIRRLTIVVDPGIEEELEVHLVALGATGYTAMRCHGAGKHDLNQSSSPAVPRVRIEVIAPNQVTEAMLDYLVRDIMPEHYITACVETVDVLRLDSFTRSEKYDKLHSAGLG